MYSPSFSAVCVAVTPPLPQPCTTVIVLHMAVKEINTVWSKHKNIGTSVGCLLCAAATAPVFPATERSVVRMMHGILTIASGSGSASVVL